MINTFSSIVDEKLICVQKIVEHKALSSRFFYNAIESHFHFVCDIPFNCWKKKNLQEPLEQRCCWGKERITQYTNNCGSKNEYDLYAVVGSDLMNCLHKYYGMN